MFMSNAKKPDARRDEMWKKVEPAITYRAYFIRTKDGWLHGGNGASYSSKPTPGVGFTDVSHVVSGANWARTTGAADPAEIVEFDVAYSEVAKFAINDPELQRRQIQAQIDELQAKLTKLNV